MRPQQTADAHHRLRLLRIERELAIAIGLDADRAYMADLERQLATWRATWVGARVTELAVGRARSGGGRPQG